MSQSRQPASSSQASVEVEQKLGAKPNFLSLAADREPGDVVAEFATELNAALERPGKDELDVAWLQGQSCTGCTISLLQGEYPDEDLKLDEFRKSIAFHPTLMSHSGERAIEALDSAPDILVIEGAIPTEVPRASTLGVDGHGNRIPMLDWVVDLAERAEMVVAVGSCAAYGGLPAAGQDGPGDTTATVGSSPTGATGVQYDGTDAGGVLGPEFTTNADLPVINVPGCPTHPDHVLLTLATVLNGHAPELDQYNRPLPMFGPLIHDECSLQEDYEAGNFADEPGDDGCLYEAGCAGVHAHCDDSKRLRNGGTTICRDVGAPCIGCVEPGFWDRFTPFYETRESKDKSGEPGTIERAKGKVPRPRSNAAGYILAIPMLVLLLPLLPVAAVAWLLKRRFGSDEPTSWSADPRSHVAGEN